MANNINSGTVQGLLDFLDYLVERGYGTNSAVHPLRSAVKQVFSKVEGDGYESHDLQAFDADDFLNRFETKARGDYKQESLTAYRKRFERALAYYRAFLDDGSTPTFRAPRGPSPGKTDSKQIRSSNSTKAAKRSATAGSAHQIAETPATPHIPTPALIDYPFPLRGGQLAYVRLPRDLQKEDAQRMGAFLLTLAIDAPRELTPGTPEEG
jgi:hypothetical protein